MNRPSEFLINPALGWAHRWEATAPNDERAQLDPFAEPARGSALCNSAIRVIAFVR
jgi:hypothetical protein